MRFPFWTPSFAGVTGVFNILLALLLFHDGDFLGGQAVELVDAHNISSSRWVT